MIPLSPAKEELLEEGISKIITPHKDLNHCIIIKATRPLERVLNIDDKNYCSSVAPHRAQEYALGRTAANYAQTLFSADADCVGRSEKGLPLFNDHYTGSISHTSWGSSAPLGISIVAPRTLYTKIGIDIESSNRPISENVLRRVLNENEKEEALHFCLENGINPIALFSAKESAYKAVKEKIGYSEIITSNFKYSECYIDFTIRLNKKEIQGILFFLEEQKVIAISYHRCL